MTTTTRFVGPMPVVTSVIDRRFWLQERCRGKHVVHMGCVDEGNTSQLVGTGDLLHEELSKVAASLVGVDVSKEGLAVMAELVPGPYVVGDVEHLEDVDLPDTCDVVVAAELIEHLGAPMRFLTGLRDYLGRTGARGIITTPNAYSLAHMVQLAVRRREAVHADHLFLYSPRTLARSVEQAGLTTVDTYMHRWRRPSRGMRDRFLNGVEGVALKVNPYVALGLVLEVEAT